jgi:hypothetical protein
LRQFANALLIAALITIPLAASAGPDAREAVIAADKAWGLAEQRGDAAFVDALLLPGYRSVGPDGRVHDKAAILAHTRQNAGSDAAAKRVAAWNANHPSEMTVVISGDTAILTFSPRASAAGPPVLSSDVFARVDGRWRPLYSQHSTAEGS